MITRRLFFTGAAASLITAPAIVRAASLMPVRALGHKFVLRTALPAAAWRQMTENELFEAWSQLHTMIYDNPEVSPLQFTGFRQSWSDAE